MSLSSDLRVEQSIVKIVGLLGNMEFIALRSLEAQLISEGYAKDLGPPDKFINGNWEKNIVGIKAIKDGYYPDFRDIMYFKGEFAHEDRKELCRRYKRTYDRSVTFCRGKSGGIQQELEASVTEVEIFLFPGQIGIFSLALVVEEGSRTLGILSDLVNLARNFDTKLKDGGTWHEWISGELLCGRSLRGEKVKTDEYSGSKFKVFQVIDAPVTEEDRIPLLFELGTVSKIGSVHSSDNAAPHPHYYEEIVRDRISIFKNWEALSLFDTFTCIGTGLLVGDSKNTWGYTYFRIYIFQIFIKFSLFRYNSDLHENTLRLRDAFNAFMNDFNLSHISFNFLPNEIYSKVGKALKLDQELSSFRNRINGISQAIQEEKQSRTNTLLFVVTLLGAISSAEPVISAVYKLKGMYKMSDASFYTYVSLISATLIILLLSYLFPAERRKIVKTIKRWIF